VDAQATVKKPRGKKKGKKRSFPAVWGLRRRERRYRKQGIRRLAGVDEVGVGPLAGPVVAAAVVMPEDSAIRGVNDSKKILDPQLREDLARRIAAEAVGVGIGVARPREIDRINIYWAALQAMRRAVRRLPVSPQLVLVDARRIPDLDVPQEAHVAGDAAFYHIACASILAKTYRDALMIRLDRRYPGYGFSRHMGYPTPEHRRALKQLGPCWIHRRRYRGVAEWMQGDLEALWNADGEDTPSTGREAAPGEDA
jgi:ribonuclease HII